MTGRALLLLNGEPPKRRPEVREGDFILSADGGYNWARQCGIAPHVLIGDMDSVQGATLEGVERICFPKEKDETDGELGLTYLLDRGYREIDIYGASGRRLDHEMANYGLLVQALRRGARARLLTDDTDVYLFDRTFSFAVSPETLVSLVPFGGGVHIMNTEGLQYRIEDKTLPVGTTLGISNVVTESPMTVAVDRGMVLFYVVKQSE